MSHVRSPVAGRWCKWPAVHGHSCRSSKRCRRENTLVGHVSCRPNASPNGLKTVPGQLLGRCKSAMQVSRHAGEQEVIGRVRKRYPNSCAIIARYRYLGLSSVRTQQGGIVSHYCLWRVWCARVPASQNLAPVRGRNDRPGLMREQTLHTLLAMARVSMRIVGAVPGNGTA